MAPTTQQRPIQHSDAFRKTSGLAGGKVEKKTPPQQHLNMPAKKPITYSQIVNAETHSLTSGLEEIYNCSAYLGIVIITVGHKIKKKSRPKKLVKSNKSIS